MKNNHSEVTNTKNYQTFLKEIKQQIQSSQVKAIGAVKSEMTILYFNIGKAITQKQKEEGWGAMVIKKLSLDLRNELPKVKGFSERNIKFMHQFYNEYVADEVKGKLPVSLLQVSWSHNIILIQKIKDKELL